VVLNGGIIPQHNTRYDFTQWLTGKTSEGMDCSFISIVRWCIQTNCSYIDPI
jgi:hypothetical protein